MSGGYSGNAALPTSVNALNAILDSHFRRTYTECGGGGVDRTRGNARAVRELPALFFRL